MINFRKVSSIGLLVISLLAAFGYAEQLDEAMQPSELDQAISWMHDLGMTKFDTTDDFRPDDYVTRQEAAKFFSQFATNVRYQVIDQNKFCGFDDLDQADPSLVNHILNSCLLGLFQGTAGYFKPTEQFTKAQALAVLIRTLQGPRNEETLPWWINYFWKAQEWGLTKEIDPYALDRPLLRYEMALLLYRAGTEEVNQIVANDTSDHTVADEQVVKVDELIKTGGGE